MGIFPSCYPPTTVIAPLQPIPFPRPLGGLYMCVCVWNLSVCRVFYGCLCRFFLAFLAGKLLQPIPLFRKLLPGSKKETPNSNRTHAYPSSSLAHSAAASRQASFQLSHRGQRDNRENSAPCPCRVNQLQARRLPATPSPPGHLDSLSRLSIHLLENANALTGGRTEQ